MELRTVIFYGCTGSGKGTQAELLKKYLEGKDPEHRVLHMGTGQRMRELAQVDSYTGRRAHDMLETGALFPSFFPVAAWSQMFIDELKGNEHILIDGFPRRLEEAPILDTALVFYDRHPTDVVVLEVSEDEVVRRLLEVRKRHDDNPEEIKKRLAWYRSDVEPIIEFFKKNGHYRVHTIDGDKSVADVQESIIATLKL